MLCLKIPPRNRLLYKKMLGGLPCQKAALCLLENTSPGKTNDSFTTGELPLPLLKLVASITVGRRARTRWLFNPEPWCDNWHNFPEIMWRLMRYREL